MGRRRSAGVVPYNRALLRNQQGRLKPQFSKVSTAPGKAQGLFIQQQLTPNIWYSKITDLYGPTPAIDANSATVVSYWSTLQAGSNWQLSIRKYHVPVYFASPGDTKYDVTVSPYGPSPYTKYLQVPIPAGATPDTGSDAQIVIIDPATGCQYEMWQAVYTSASDTWSCAAMVAGPWPADGEFVNAGIRASGIPATLGMVFPEEIIAGRIDHAIGYSTDFQGANVLKPTSSGKGGAWFGSGTDTTTKQMNCGARARLKPSYDISALTGTPRIVAQALKDYGMIMIDGGGPGPGLGGARIWNNGGASWDSVADSFSGGTPLDYIPMTPIDMSQFEILDQSAAVAPPAQANNNNPCSRYA